MKELRQQINFNAFHLLIIVIIITTIINGDYSYYLFESINYLLSLNMQQFWFIITHLFAFYSIIASFEFELDFRAAIKWSF